MECPRNMKQARERGERARVEIDEVWREGLEGLEAGRKLILIYWMNRARRDLIAQIPRHGRSGPMGVFALRSPVRPNSIALATVTALDIDIEAGRIEIDAIDCLDGTPLLDVKPWFEEIDCP
jgi:tRNA-Thr(GGU) m(6)t(6)A37 methyltransferase TsaA